MLITVIRFLLISHHTTLVYSVEQYFIMVLHFLNGIDIIKVTEMLKKVNTLNESHYIFRSR